MSTAKHPGGSDAKRVGRKKHRARPVPEWLKEQQDLDEMARRRCLMILTVLSGERPVTDVIEEAKISRGMYYELETRALRAMLRALVPGAGTDGTPAAAGSERHVRELEQKVGHLEQERRRTERLLLLTRKVVKKGPMTQPWGGRPKGRRSTSGGARPSPSSQSTAPTTAAAEATSSPATTSTAAR